MKRWILGLLGATTLAFASLSHAAVQRWQEGEHFVRLPVVQRTSVPAGKVEVLEVFSYGCPGCNSFQPVIGQLEKGLPANAKMAYLHASFNRAESWRIVVNGKYRVNMDSMRSTTDVVDVVRYLVAREGAAR